VRATAIVVVLLAASAVAVYLLVPDVVPSSIDAAANPVVGHAPYEIRGDAQALHARLVIGDLHADSLLWARDLLTRVDHGHVDFPRLIEGNVALQVFPAVTKSPVGQNYEENTGDTDNITALVTIQGWPEETRSSLTARALHQAALLHEYARRAPETVRVVESVADLEAVLRARAGGAKTVGALLGLEGAHALEGELDRIAILQAAGFRIMGLHHFFDNELGGSLHGTGKGGLSHFGRAAMREMETRDVIIDVAHSSPAVVDDVLDRASRPVILSHTGVSGVCNSPRNIGDAQLKRIAEHGGLIGIGYWDGAICDISPRGVVRSIRYAIDLVGREHVALGSDYDGATEVTFDTSELAVLTQTMLDEGFTPEEIREVMGGNLVRFLRENLPQT
jgi:microsomal dipeptidase-like Zn-dependent dipeptidase